MATCEELLATITSLQAALAVDDFTIQAAQNVKTAHQMDLWYTQYNFFLQGCGGGSGSGDGSGTGSGSGSGFSLSADQKLKLPAFPVRTPSEILLIMTNQKLFDLHKEAEGLARMVGVVV